MAGAELRWAIARRAVVEFRYSGRRRVVHPHVMFYAPTGNVCLDGLQVAGSSSSGALPDWRQFDVASIGDVTLSDDRFDVAPDFNPAAPKYRDGIVAIVDRSRS